jgi:hypothetical protein
MNYGQKRPSNRGIYYVGTANDNLMKFFEFCKATEFFYYFCLNCINTNVFPTFSNLSIKILKSYCWSKTMSVVRNILHQPCKKLKPLQDHAGTIGIPKLFSSLQKRTGIHSQVKAALTMGVLICLKNHTITFFQIQMKYTSVRLEHFCLGQNKCRVRKVKIHQA